ncbi:MAG: hypothetical protein ABIM49_04000 [candidate division WOR-3 bacterium]|uniref:Uncharacterized protein n=1 Tax=candidate division WOR-3 bacterium TaxID=2052148 RepID=A0A7V3ZSJ9_UNCW3
MNISLNPWIWIAAILTIAIFSFLYKDNPLYKFAEHLLVGVTVGYYINIYWHNAAYPYIIKPLFLEKQFLTLIPFMFAILYFSILIPKYSYFIRYPIGFLLGALNGMAISPEFKEAILVQVKDTILPPFSFSLEFFNSLIIFIGTLCVLIYFFFSLEHKGVLKGFSRIGIIFLMIGFGASFGYTVMARISLLIGRIIFLLKDWLGIIR